MADSKELLKKSVEQWWSWQLQSQQEVELWYFGLTIFSPVEEFQDFLLQDTSSIPHSHVFITMIIICNM